MYITPFTSKNKKSFFNFKKSIVSSLAVSLVLIGCNSNANDANSVDSPRASNTTNSSKVVSNKSDADVVAALEANFKSSGFEQKIISATPTQMENIYWITAEGTPSFFSDKDGRYIIQGQIIDIGSEQPVELSAELVAATAKEKLAAVDKKEMIIYPAKAETKAVVYSFTDADCPYCSKLHEEMDEINDLGIEVRYLAWPRSEPSVPKMQSIWCSDDRKQAMDKAKAGDKISAKKCDDPVMSHIELGMNLGVTGTPAIFTESGVQIGGYLPAKELAKLAIANK